MTAALHLGHALNNTLQDVLVRAHRMMGFETLWLPGTDHAGIATQAVVEKRLLSEQGKRRTDYSREEFVRLVQAWKDEYEAVISGQLRQMGCSCDWERQRFTMDDVCARAVREGFFRLFQAGLIYRGKRLVNWDPVTQTALADDEVDTVEVAGSFYSLRYPLCDVRGAPAKAKMPDGSVVDHVTVATTRPETYLGDTAVGVNPRDPRAGALRGKFVRLPFVGRVIPIIEDEYVVMPAPDPDAPGVDVKAKYATGFLKVTPAHDPNDWEIGQRHKLPVINVMAPDASISDQHGWTDVGDARRFVGLTREKAREVVLAEFKKAGLLEKVVPYTHGVGHSYRSHAAIEPYLSDQWYVKVTDPRLARSAQRALVAEQRSVTSNAGAAPPLAGGAGLRPAHSHASTVKGVPDTLQIHRRRLPHWQSGGSTYFVTFRLAQGRLSEAEREVVGAACEHWNGERAVVHQYVVMPDHVHLLLTPLQRAAGVWHSLPELIGGIKKFAAREIQAQRAQSGPLWQDEHFDRLIRDEDEFYEKAHYIWDNPRRAGLVGDQADYRWLRTPRDNRGIGEGGSETRPTRGRRDSGETDGDGSMRFSPERYAKTYEAWHDNIRDWCISRQLWWGHRIPVWSRECPEPHDAAFFAWLTKQAKTGRASVRHGGVVASTSRTVVDADGETVYESEVVFEHGGRTDLFVCVADPEGTDRDFVKRLEEAGFQQDPDVLDTWFSSGLWPLSTLGWPDPSQTPEFAGLLDAFNPSAVLCTAREIITLWVSRMVMFNRFFLGENQGDPDAFVPGRVPFRDVFIHAMIQDGEGRKMSKSLGNGVDPLDIIHTHGADAMRFTLCDMATQTQDVRMPVDRDPASGRNTSPKFDLGMKFCNKLWNAARFTLMMIDEAEPDAGAPPARPRLIDRWMLSRLAGAVADAEAALREYQFSSYARTMYDLLWRDFCDWYLEGVKPTVKADPRQRATLRASLDTILRLLHPVCPFVTEVIGEKLREVEAPEVPGVDLPPFEMLCTAPWPRVAGDLRDEEAERAFERLRTLVTAVRDARAALKIPPRKRLSLHVDAALAKEIGAADGLVETLAGVERVTTDAPRGASSALVFEAVEHRLSGLTDATDSVGERERLSKQMADLEKSIRTIEGRLNNPGYIQKAPAKLVEESKALLGSLRAEHATAKESLERLG